MVSGSNDAPATLPTNLLLQNRREVIMRHMRMSVSRVSDTSLKYSLQFAEKEYDLDIVGCDLSDADG
jgi:hypothetical protein